MSKIGNQPIKIPEKISIEVKDRLIEIKSADTVLSYRVPKNLEIVQENGQLIIKRRKESKKTK